VESDRANEGRSLEIECSDDSRSAQHDGSRLGLSLPGQQLIEQVSSHRALRAPLRTASWVVVSRISCAPVHELARLRGSDEGPLAIVELGIVKKRQGP
jgi:hypothetical protein